MIYTFWNEKMCKSYTFRNEKCEIHAHLANEMSIEEQKERGLKHLGDITKIDGAKIEPVDCITFGSPCQDLSVAGKRAGLDGERSGLFMEAVRIIKEMRNERVDGLVNEGADEPVRHPRFCIWENVQGAFSSNNGEDFRTVLEELARIKQPTITIPKCEKWKHAGYIDGDGWNIAWRLFDAQYWGVPQRRKRIALVMDFDGQRAGEILFERTGLQRDSNESIPAWKGIARNPSEGAGIDDSYTLKIRGGALNAIPQENEPGKAL